MITLRCSAADRWSRCALSAHLENLPVALPDEELEAAREGTCAAWVAETIINGDATCVEDMVGKIHKNGVEVDEDMARFIRPYVEKMMTRRGARAEVYREAVHQDGSVKVAGTLDCESWDGDTFCIDDLKYGFGIVEATTRQILAYAMLAFLSGVRAPKWRLSIYQPRAIHPEGDYRSVEYTEAELMEKINTLWSEAVVTVTAQQATPGEQCMYCSAANGCMALTKTVYAMWKPLTDRLFVQPSPQQLSDELEMISRLSDLLKARKTAVETEASVRLKQGEFISGWAIMPTTGNRKFKFPADVIEAFTGVSPIVESVCTPAELERRGASKVIVDALSEKPTVGYKLGRYNPSTVAAMFKRNA